MFRDAAIKRLESEGFRAFKRDWKMGATIGVAMGDGPGGNPDGPFEGATKLIYLFSVSGEWGIVSPDYDLTADYSRRYSLEDACAVVRSLFSCGFLPLAPESVLIHHVRTDGGGCQILEHVPTGTKKLLSRSDRGGREVLLSRDQALAELIYELALKSAGKAG